MKVIISIWYFDEDSIYFNIGINVCLKIKISILILYFIYIILYFSFYKNDKIKF